MQFRCFDNNSLFKYDRIPVDIEWIESSAGAAPGQEVITRPDQPRLIRFVDPAGRWPIPEGANVAADLGIRANSEDLQTDAINGAIKELSESGGGTIHFPAGLYTVSTVRMQSNVTLHLAEGARIQGTTDVDAYPMDEEGILYTDLPTSLIPGPRRRVIYWDHCENAALIGRGIIDGQGSELRRLTCHTPAGRPLINLMKFVHCRNCRVEGVMLHDSEFWNTHVLLSEDILFDSVKIVNERPPAGWASYVNPKHTWWWNNTDGINPDSSQDITIRNCFFHTGDDCTAVKNTGTYKNELKNVRNIHIHDNMMIGATPMKIGTETRGAIIEDVLWENNRVITCARPIAAEMKDGAVARNITWRNIVVEECNRPFDLEIILRQDEPDQKHFSSLENISIENLDIERYRIEEDWYQSHIRGLDAEHGISGVQLSGICLEGRIIQSVEDMELEVNEFAQGIRFDS
ncbi:MAG: glycoside hydrolase family 28 protein [Puniceicoccaceae bacterium]